MDKIPIPTKEKYKEMKAQCNKYERVQAKKRLGSKKH
jgi:hypothetical protein